MGCDFRIIDYNYPFQSNVSLSASSSDSSFPVSNLSHFFRSKVWRSNQYGHFTIGPTNKFIDFDIGGSDLLSTLIEGEYTAQTLATHIAAKMTASAGTTISCSYSTSTNKFTISKASGTLNLLWDSGANTANSVGSSIGFDVTSDDTGSLSYSSGQTVLHTEEWVQIDTLSTESIDTFAIVFDPSFGNKFSEEAVIKLQANATANFYSPAVNQTLTYDNDRGIYSHIFTTDQEYRYWRVSIVDPHNPYGYVELGKIILGKSSQPARDPEIGFSYKMLDQSVNEENSYGIAYSDIYPLRQEIELTFKLLNESDLDTLTSIYTRVGSTVPIAVFVDAQGQIFDKDRFFIYGKLGNEMAFKHIVRNYFDHTMRITESF